MSGLKALLITYFYPPLASAETVATTKFVRGLSRLGLELVALTSEGSNTYGQDTSLAELLPEGIPVHRVPVYEPGFLFKTPLRLAPFVSAMPDAMWGWAWRARRLVGDVVRKERPDIIISRSQPFSSHFVAAEAKRLSGLPWLACFSDPLADNAFYYPFPINPHRWVNRQIEGWVIKQADEVHLTSEETHQILARGGGRNFQSKLVSIPHSYDPDLYPQDHLRRPTSAALPVVIRHLGAFTGSRNPVNLLKALRRMVASDTRLAERVKVELIGRIRPDHEHLIRDWGLSNVVRVVPLVSYRDSLALMVESDVLLLIDGIFPEGQNIFFPSKLVDYIGANRPILALSPKDSTSTRILADLGVRTYAPDSVEAIAEGLNSILRQTEKPTDARKYELNQVSAVVHQRVTGLVKRLREGRT